MQDLDKFPSGMAALGSWIKSQPTYPGSPDMMRYGLYSCRGTCQCGTGTYSAPGSHGYEKEDTDWMIAAGAQYLKIDSCCGDQNHATAFSDYAKFRDAMNASGSQVWFSLCGWESWYSPPDPSIGYLGGASLGNSWRIAGDGDSWGALTNCMNTQAGAAPYAGMGGWPGERLMNECVSEEPLYSTISRLPPLRPMSAWSSRSRRPRSADRSSGVRRRPDG